MRVTLVRTGGVSGIRREASFEAGDLTPEEAAAVRDCVEKLHAEPPARRLPSRSPERDRFHYTLTLEETGACRTIAFREGEEPPAVRPLLAALAGPSRSRG
jgi:hypothetical protein